MFPTSQAIGRAVTRRARATWLAATVSCVAMLCLAASGCSVVRTINNVRHAVDSNQQAIKAFTQGLKAGEATAFAATYVTTGSSPTTVSYAVQPPKEVAFTQSSAGNGGSGSLDLVSNANGEYSCTSATGNSDWTCQKLGRAEAVAQNEIVSLYTPSHWVTFLETFSIAAGFAGDKVTNSTMTVNGFPMNCVDFVAKGVKGTSTICTTAQNILGYVKVAGNPTSFEVKSYTGSPSASLFQLPAGAKVTTSN